MPYTELVKKLSTPNGKEMEWGFNKNFYHKKFESENEQVSGNKKHKIKYNSYPDDLHRKKGNRKYPLSNACDCAMSYGPYKQHKYERDTRYYVRQ